jgi:hypothetical protein
MQVLRLVVGQFSVQVHQSVSWSVVVLDAFVDEGVGCIALVYIDQSVEQMPEHIAVNVCWKD